MAVKNQKSEKPTQEFYGHFQYLYDFFNRELFEGVLPNCMIVVIRKKRTFGMFIKGRWEKSDDRTTDEIAINPTYFDKYPLIEILQTLVHEMAHQWQYHFGKPSRYSYHNKEWANKMISIGLMPSTTGLPGGKITGQKMMDYPIANGPFVNASNKLLQENTFKDLWFDKLKEHSVIPISQEVFSLVYESSGLSEVLIESSDQGGTAGASNNSSPIKDIKKYKIKYTCEGCSANVWGKPELHIKCGCEKSTTHKFRFIAQTVLPQNLE